MQKNYNKINFEEYSCAPPITGGQEKENDWPIVEDTSKERKNSNAKNNKLRGQITDLRWESPFENNSQFDKGGYVGKPKDKGKNQKNTKNNFSEKDSSKNKGSNEFNVDKQSESIENKKENYYIRFEPDVDKVNIIYQYESEEEEVEKSLKINTNVPNFFAISLDSPPNVENTLENIWIKRSNTTKSIIFKIKNVKDYEPGTYEKTCQFTYKKDDSDIIKIGNVFKIILSVCD